MRIPLEQFLAMQQGRHVLVERPISTEEQAVLDDVAALNAQALLFARMAMSVSSENDTPDGMSRDEIEAFTERWSQAALNTCLRAGMSAIELRYALHTGTLPDKGLTLALADLRHRSSSTAVAPLTRGV